ncbi:fumarylacetoacetate hydrolase family protein [Brevibacillus fulvus]|uniref:2-keto-4-pentenoate hydratase/2-oxohepta-3-ene-1,7-dioic acid hydratase in catechol pathway n=1 Tax=Brevibacillus fulvus TaxID=1125967 RepID=A0A939BTT5_9BACL|nr:fumarylacetoacetate hydrolase family protein [Brevibacillus fulvus]MBM7588796.1 2-keto-4-pentenoate hydratase/2-oxohepta-3-ene-1,7-dioic acid hydratase in catechol pathway [Brevibacillus fulvus]
MEPIHNVFCVGRNYRLHAQELGNEVPKSPFLFLKPTRALVEANGSVIPLPGQQGELHHEVELVVHIAKPYQKGMSVEDVVDRIALGIDFTLRDVQSEIKKKGHPWLLAKGFRNSAVITPFHPFPGVAACQQTDFHLQKNGEIVQTGNIKDMLFDLLTILEFTTQHYGLSTGDIIYTGTPAGVGPVADQDKLTMLWGQENWGEFTVNLV